MVHDKLKFQTYLAISIIVAATIHVLFGVYFAFLGIYLIVALNVFDVIIYIITFFINKAGKIRAASFILVLKIVLFSLIATFLMGTNVNAQWFIMIAALPAALYLDFTKVQKAVIVASMPILINVQMAFPLFFTPLFDMSDNTFLRLIFANVIVIGSIFAVALNAIISHRISDMQKKQIDDYHHISNIDPLTELKNRRYANQFFEKLIAGEYDMPCLFCMIDIDNFKHVNDQYGHNTGDIVLKTVAEVLLNCTRQTDLVCRWGGEEFLLCLPKCDTVNGRNVLEKIRQAVQDKIIPTDAGDIKVTITGGATALSDVTTIEATLETCDKNLYEGKRGGKNRMVL